MQHKFDIYFSGETLEEQDVQQVKEAVGRLFKLSGNKLDALFSGKQKRIKKDLNVEQSGRFREAFRKIGAIVHIVPAGKLPTQKAAPSKTKETSSRWSLMPAGTNLNPLPRTGGEERTVSEANVAAMEIAPVSPLPQEPVSEPPADIDISYLQATPAKSGSLEEFATTKEPVPIPDTSALAIDSDEKPIQNDTDSDASADLPDISYLQATPAKTGSLEEYAQEKEPVPIPDISNISLDR
jgi:hypothetical protein